MTLSNTKDINQLTRDGKNPCPTCKVPMRMYFSPWCELCDKPEVYNTPTLNFVQVLQHLEALGRVGIEDRLWSYFEEDIRNDSSFELPFDVGLEDPDLEILTDLALIKSTWAIEGDSIQMDVSW